MEVFAYFVGTLEILFLFVSVSIDLCYNKLEWGLTAVDNAACVQLCLEVLF